jgi:hypothetical protein
MSTLTWKDELIKLYLKGTRYMNIMTGTMLGFMAAFAYPLLHLWLGSAGKFAPAVPILMIFCIPFQINSLTGPASAYHRGVGHPIRELVYPATQFALVVLFVSLGFLLVGKTTIVIAVAVGSAMVLSGLIYIVYSNSVMGVPQLAFLTQSLVPGLVPYVFGFAVAWASSPLFDWAATSRLRLACMILTSGVFYLVVVSAVLYRAFCPWGEREYLRKQVLHSFGSILDRQGA